MDEYSSDNIRYRLERLGAVQEIEFTTAAGNRADTKLELDVMHSDSRLYADIIGGLAVLAAVFRPDILVPVPSGGVQLVEDLSARMKLPYVVPKKDTQDPIGFKMQNRQIAGVLTANKQRALLVDDVLTTGSSMLAVSNLKEIKGKVCSGIAVWDRSEPSMRPESTPFATAALIKHHVPLINTRKR